MLSHRTHVALALFVLGLVALGCKRSGSSTDTGPVTTLSTRPVETEAPPATATASSRGSVENVPPIASGEKSATAAREDLVDPTGESCPTGYTRAAGAPKCHRMCRRDQDCHAPNTCVAVEGSRTKVCDAK